MCGFRSLQGASIYTSLVKVAIDARRIGDFGVGTYTRNLIGNLARLDRDTRYIVVGNSEKLRMLGPLPGNFHIVNYSRKGNTFRSILEFRQIVQRLECDLVHVPHLFRIPRLLPCPYIMTVHDLLEHMHEDRLRRPWDRWLRYRLAQGTLARAAKILAVSEFTRREVTRVFGVRERRIEVVHNAIDDRFLLGHASDEERQAIVDRYQVNYPFVLYTGRISPHKNVARIIEAFSALKAELRRPEINPEGQLLDLKLLIVGDELSRHPDLRRTVVRSRMQQDVRFLGFVPIEVLRVFYDAAKLFVFPSLYEGFGLPPLEAMAHGTPVVASNFTALPEVVGPAALLVNPENVFEVMRAMQKALLDRPTRERLKQAGYLQVRKFSWETSVRRTIEVYKETARKQHSK